MAEDIAPAVATSGRVLCPSGSSSNQQSYSGPRIRQDEKHAKQELWQRETSLRKHFNRALRHENLQGSAVKALIALNATKRQAEVPLTLESYLLEEAKRIIRLKAEHSLMVDSARPLARWALQETPEANPRVAAKFAVEFVFDHYWRIIARTHLSESRPTRWFWEKTENPVRHPSPRQKFSDAEMDYLPPFLGEDIDILQNYRAPVDPYLQRSILIEPDLPLGKRHHRMVDSLRPPLAAVRLAAHFTRGNTQGLLRSALTVELGHSVGAQALSIWLPEAIVHTWSAVFSPEIEPNIPEESADTVVLGVPSLRRMRFVNMMANPHREIDRRVVDHFWTHQEPDPLIHVEPLVEAARSYVKCTGILIVIGGVEDGEHHEANRLVRESGEFDPIHIKQGNQSLDTTHRPVEIIYRKHPWCPFGILPPGDRLLSAWRRVR